LHPAAAIRRAAQHSIWIHCTSTVTMKLALVFSLFATAAAFSQVRIRIQYVLDI
jgi:hypothetical protein